MRKCPRYKKCRFRKVICAGLLFERKNCPVWKVIKKRKKHVGATDKSPKGISGG